MASLVTEYKLNTSIKGASKRPSSLSHRLTINILWSSFKLFERINKLTLFNPKFCHLISRWGWAAPTSPSVWKYLVEEHSGFVTEQVSSSVACNGCGQTLSGRLLTTSMLLLWLCNRHQTNLVFSFYNKCLIKLGGNYRKIGLKIIIYYICKISE